MAGKLALSAMRQAGLAALLVAGSAHAAGPRATPVRPTPAVAAAPAAPAARIALPPPEAMIIMIRATLVALSQANATNNYSVLHDLGSPNFRAANPVEKLRAAFTPFRQNQIDLVPVVYVTPRVTAAPAIDHGQLRMVGIFPTQPLQITYDIQFEPIEGVWKLALLNIGIVRLAAAQPTLTRAAPAATDRTGR